MATAADVISEAIRSAKVNGDFSIGCEHILLAFTRLANDEDDSLLRTVLKCPPSLVAQQLYRLFPDRLSIITTNHVALAPRVAGILRGLSQTEGGTTGILSWEYLLLGVLENLDDKVSALLTYVDVGKARQALTHRIESITYLLRLLRDANQQYVRGCYEQAIAISTHALEQHPKYGPALYQRGRALAALNQFEAALADYTAAISYVSDRHVVHESRALAYLALDELDKALEDYTAAIKLTPTADLHVARGEVLDRLGKTDAAAEDFAAAVELDPECAAGHYHLGLARLRMEDLDAGCRLLERASALGHPTANDALQKRRKPRWLPRFFRNHENPAVRTALKQLRYGDGDVRLRAVEALAEAECAEAAPFLLRLVEDSDEQVRAASGAALARIRDYRTTEPLLGIVLDKTRAEKVRECARQALEQIRDVRAIPAFIRALKHDVVVKGFVSTSLGRFGTAAIIPLSTEFRKSSQRDVRLAIVAALASIGEPAVTGPLLEIMESRDVRKEAGDAFENLLRADTAMMLPHLRNWYSGKPVAKRLSELSWKPADDADAVHLQLALRNGNLLRQHWSTTERVLLDDVGVAKYEVVENALYGFIGLGRAEVLGTLVNKLQAAGNKIMAEAFLNSGNETLEEAARRWAAARGYQISRGPGENPVSWGAF